jgi:hypothetical protein
MNDLNQESVFLHITQSGLTRDRSLFRSLNYHMFHCMSGREQASKATLNYLTSLRQDFRLHRSPTRLPLNFTRRRGLEAVGGRRCVKDHSTCLLSKLVYLFFLLRIKWFETI